MAKITGATNTQKTILLALTEGWHLRYAGSQGWCLFQAGRQRPFAQVAISTIEKMTQSGWLSEGVATREMGFRPEKLLTTDGSRYAQRLIDKHWAQEYEWDPYRAAGAVDPASTLGEQLVA